MKNIEDDVVIHTAKLAKIKIEEKDIPKIKSEFKNIINFIDQLNEVDVDGVEPMTSVGSIKLKMRSDKVTDGGYVDKILENAPETRDTYIATPKIIE